MTFTQAVFQSNCSSPCSLHDMQLPYTTATLQTSWSLLQLLYTPCCFPYHMPLISGSWSNHKGPLHIEKYRDYNESWSYRRLPRQLVYATSWLRLEGCWGESVNCVSVILTYSLLCVHRSVHKCKPCQCQVFRKEIAQNHLWNTWF